MTDNGNTARRRRHQRRIIDDQNTVESGASDSEGPIFADNNNNINIDNKKKIKRRRKRDEDQPFSILVLQVGSTLFVICFVTYILLRATIWKRDSTAATDAEGDDDNLRRIEKDELEKMGGVPVITLAPVPPTEPPLPVWELGPASKFDAFGIANLYDERFHQSSSHANDKTVDHSLDSFWRIAKKLRDEFAAYYGGENAARALLERGLKTFGVQAMISQSKNDNMTASSNFTTESSLTMKNPSSQLPSDLVHTACRLRQAKREERPFRFAFGGYSVTVGRGNHFHQSFPFFMRDRLSLAFSRLGLDLEVKNAAIGGCSAFPYGWCMTNFWGSHVDVVSWDYSMNEAGGVPQGMEAYLRHALMLPRRPMMIVKDTHLANNRRNDILRQYLEMGLVKDSLIIHSDPAAQPFLQRKEEFRPLGFQEWRKFGAPLGAPGQAYHHPALKEHEMMGWMLAMHFLSALELVAADMVSPLPLQCDPIQPSRVLPPPVTVRLDNDNATVIVPWQTLLFGQPSTAAGDEWTMNPVQCRTTFEPILDGDMKSIVVGGTVAEDLDVMLPKSEMFYNQGWVYDMSKGEKEAKQKLDRFGGLGFVDRKKAYYGIYSSGALQLLLPIGTSHVRAISSKVNDSNRALLTESPQMGDKATKWIQTIVICQVNEKRDIGSCNIETDLSFQVGGVNVTNSHVIDSVGVLYLGQKICMYVSVPAASTLTTKRLASQVESHKRPTRKKKKKQKKMVLDVDLLADDQVGLSIEIIVNNHHIMSREFACSISHVIWEEVVGSATIKPMPTSVDSLT